jgi:hypothetical protein
VSSLAKGGNTKERRCIRCRVSDVTGCGKVAVDSAVAAVVVAVDGSFFVGTGSETLADSVRVALGISTAVVRKIVSSFHAVSTRLGVEGVVGRWSIANTVGHVCNVVERAGVGVGRRGCRAARL